MKLFNLDCHISVIADLKKIFEDLNHQVTSWSVSGHNWVFDREPSKVDVVNQNKSLLIPCSLVFQGNLAVRSDNINYLKIFFL